MVLGRAKSRLWASLLAVAWAALSARPFGGTDGYWHATLGRAVLAERARIVTERWAIPGFHDRCAAQEWLWDVGAYLVQARFGWKGIGVVVVVLAALAAIGCFRLVTWTERKIPFAAVVFVTAAVSPLVLSRILDRPETAVMALLPVFLLACERLGAAASARVRLRLTVALVLLELLWAQLHPSFVLAPAIAFIVAGERLWRAERRLAIALGLALFVGLFSSALGAGFLRNVLAHASGDAVAHVIDMSPPTWSLANPAVALHYPLFALLWVGALAGLVRGRILPRRELALALLGLLLALRARRGLGPGSELLLPLAFLGWGALLDGLPRRVALVTLGAATAAAVALFVRLAGELDVGEGPLGTLGLAEAAHPRRAADLLRTAPEGMHVLTSYEAGSPLGFWLDGRVRTYVDGRTPLLFDAPEFAAARAVWSDPDALERAISVYAFDAAVVERASPSCVALAEKKTWRAVVVEAAHTTFVREETKLGRPVAFLAPCGADYFVADACEDGGAALGRELDALPSDPFVSTLRVAARIECTRGSLNADALVAALPSRASSAGFLAERDGLLAWILVRAGHTDDALDLVWPYVRMGDQRAAARVASVLDASKDRHLRPLMERLLAQNDDRAAPWVFGLLASACAREGDLDCAATHGMHAAALGETAAFPALCAVARDHTDTVTRGEATQWLEALRRAPRKGRAPPPLSCP